MDRRSPKEGDTMFRTLVVLLAVTGMAVGGPSSQIEPSASPPFLYEVQINGESFLVEANRQTKLESKARPGVRYDLAVRVAPTQRVNLSTIEFEYDLPAKVEVSGPRQNRSARLTHELGFSVLVCDLGRPLNDQGQKEALKDLVKSVTATLREAKEQDIGVTEPHERKFTGLAARGASIRYVDAKGFRHVCLVYVLAGPNCAATCVAEYLDGDSDDVLPLIRKTLDSIRAIEMHR
jgi:hypothetical protein